MYFVCLLRRWQRRLLWKTLTAQQTAVLWYSFLWDELVARAALLTFIYFVKFLYLLFLFILFLSFHLSFSIQFNFFFPFLSINFPFLSFSFEFLSFFCDLFWFPMFSIFIILISFSFRSERFKDCGSYSCTQHTDSV